MHLRKELPSRVPFKAVGADPGDDLRSEADTDDMEADADDAACRLVRELIFLEGDFKPEYSVPNAGKVPESYSTLSLFIKV